MALRAVEGAVCISEVEALFKLRAQGGHLVSGEKRAQDDEAKGLKVLVLFAAEHGISPVGCAYPALRIWARRKQPSTWSLTMPVACMWA